MAEQQRTHQLFNNYYIPGMRCQSLAESFDVRINVIQVLLKVIYGIIYCTTVYNRTAATLNICVCCFVLIAISVVCTINMYIYSHQSI
jgi:hypothetical protein